MDGVAPRNSKAGLRRIVIRGRPRLPPFPSVVASALQFRVQTVFKLRGSTAPLNSAWKLRGSNSAVRSLRSLSPGSQPNEDRPAGGGSIEVLRRNAGIGG